MSHFDYMPLLSGCQLQPRRQPRADPTAAWKKHLLADKQPGATNIQQADVNGDGKTDFIATRGHGNGVIWSIKNRQDSSPR